MGIENTRKLTDQLHPANWGMCPVCGKHNGYVNLGAEFWIICHQHKTKWSIGDDLLAGWQDQSASQFYKVENILSKYNEVYPLW